MGDDGTLTPGNPAGFQVEMGSVGQHCYHWRYQIPEDDGEPDTGARPCILSLERPRLPATNARITWPTDRPTTSRLEDGTPMPAARGWAACTSTTSSRPSPRAI